MYLQTANVLKQRIRAGRYEEGAMLPTVRDLGEELGVSIHVVQRALRVLDEDGVVEPRHGIGVRILPSDTVQKTPLTFGLVYPFPIKTPFAKVIHIFIEATIDVRRNYCVIKSSNGDPEKERQVVDQFLRNGLVGLFIWPCEGTKNVDYFTQVADRVPLVFVDRRFDEVPAPSVTLDYAAAGRDIAKHLAHQGHRRVLILECPWEISSYHELYASMRQTIRDIRAEDRFDFVSVNTRQFVEHYAFEPALMVRAYEAEMEEILAKHSYDAMFSPHDDFIDFIYASTDLRQRYPLAEIVSLSGTFPNARSIAFYELGVLEWICDFEGMMRRASDMLHERVFRKNRARGEVRIKLTPIVRTSDAPLLSNETLRNED